MERKECIIDKKDQEKIVKKAFEKGENLGRAVSIMLDTGVHVAVICDPKRFKVQITPDNKILSWVRPRTLRPLALYISDRIRPYIRDFFLNPSKKRYHRSYYNLLLMDIQKGLSPNVFRHTYIFNKMVEGYTIPEVSAMCGASFRTLERFYLLMKQFRKAEDLVSSTKAE